jgi:hypothetical protein
MKRLMLTALLAGSLAAAADTPGQQRVSPTKGLTPWYERGLSQFTENKPDLGAGIEARRQRSLEASIRSRYFWFGLGSTLLNVCLVGLYLFKRRELEFKLDQASGWIADLWNRTNIRERRHARQLRAITGTSNSAIASSKPRGRAQRPLVHWNRAKQRPARSNC